MMRWQIWTIIVVMIFGVWRAFAAPVYDPADYTGKWYACEDGVPYLFHNGIIISEKYHLSVSEGEIFSGAYSFAKDKILLFILSEDGVEQVHELQLISAKEGDVLCEITAEGKRAVFSRNKK